MHVSGVVENEKDGNGKNEKVEIEAYKDLRFSKKVRGVEE